MKSYLLLILLTCATLQAQSNLIQTSGNQLDYFKSIYNDSKVENGDISFNSNVLDSIILIGESTNNHFGYSVSCAGDVNGDGYSDVIVGAYQYNNFQGRAYIFYGGSSINNIADVTITGEAIDDYFGRVVSTAGDVNKDGYSDVIIGAPYNDTSGLDIGRAYIYFGSPSMNNIADVIMTGETTSKHFGWSVCTAGDVNKDGFSDVIVGTPTYSSEKGRAYIFYGSPSMNNVADVIMTGEAEHIFFGYSVSTAGDVNGDGRSDVIVGANLYNTFNGKAYIFYGDSLMNNVADVIMTGETTSSQFGSPVTTAGDVNGDGYSDVIVGAPEYSSGKGRAYIFYGSPSMNNVADVVMTGDTVHNWFGQSVSTADDVNRDGFSDVIVGAPGFKMRTGRSYIFYGSPSMNNTVDKTMTGEAINNYFGQSVSTADDVNSDGLFDLIVGADYYNNQIGVAYLYINLIPKPLLINPINNSTDNPTIINFNWRNLDSAIYYVLNISIDSLFNNVIVTDTIFNDTFKTVSGFQKNRKYYWKVSAKNSLGITYSSLIWNFTTIPPIYSNIKILFEGMYSPPFNQLIRKDSVKVYLRNSFSPYALIDSTNGTIDSISFSGLFNFVNASSGTYYLIVKHFNCIETWSKAGGENLTTDGTIYNYDFTTANSQAYGNNLKLKGSKYCLFSGDVNQDGFIDLFDVVPIYNGAINFITGNYLATDLTGDGIIDLTDVNISYNNSSNFIRVRRP